MDQAAPMRHSRARRKCAEVLVFATEVAMMIAMGGPFSANPAMRPANGGKLATMVTSVSTEAAVVTPRAWLFRSEERCGQAGCY
jgi:hypothetical protein